MRSIDSGCSIIHQSDYNGFCFIAHEFKGFKGYVEIVQIGAYSYGYGFSVGSGGLSGVAGDSSVGPGYGLSGFDPPPDEPPPCGGGAGSSVGVGVNVGVKVGVEVGVNVGGTGMVTAT